MKIRITKAILNMPENQHLKGIIPLGWHKTNCSSDIASKGEQVPPVGISCCGESCPENPSNGKYSCVMCNCILIPNP